jgi:hypothetical protein
MRDVHAKANGSIMKFFVLELEASHVFLGLLRKVVFLSRTEPLYKKMFKKTVILESLFSIIL